MDDDGQNLPLVTFPKLLLARKKITASQLKSAAGTSIQTFAPFPLAASFPLCPQYLARVSSTAEERRAFQEGGRAPSASW